jgi:hypothetical protein
MLAAMGHATSRLSCKEGTTSNGARAHMKLDRCSNGRPAKHDKKLCPLLAGEEKRTVVRSTRGNATQERSKSPLSWGSQGCGKMVATTA